MYQGYRTWTPMGLGASDHIRSSLAGFLIMRPLLVEVNRAGVPFEADSSLMGCLISWSRSKGLLLALPRSTPVSLHPSSLHIVSQHQHIVFSTPNERRLKGARQNKHHMGHYSGLEAYPRVEETSVVL
uniref:Uncharacterized protein n=1 Tax=Timema poppense TaxID=170557 RepID=A0A7R9H9X7_TIMPO|nr:unnamed protein product [Timema poppensis]